MAGVTIDLTGTTFGLTLSEVNDLDITQSGAVLIPALIISGVGTVEYNFSSLEIPKIGVSGTGLVGIVGRSESITLPTFIVRGYDNSIAGLGDIQIPAFTINSAGIVSILGVGNVKIPLPFASVDSFGHIDSVVLGDVSIPVLSVYGFGFLTVPNGIYKAIVVNAFNYAVTEYFNFNLNSFAKFRGTVVASGPQGIYTLDSKKDDGSPIYAEFRTGLSDLRSQFYKYVRELWLVLKTDGQLEIVVQAGEEVIWNHELEIFTKALDEIRGKVARGLKARHFGFGLRNVNGSDFDVDSLRVKVEIVRGRTR
jgi:hypothetical protein